MRGLNFINKSSVDNVYLNLDDVNSIQSTHFKKKKILVEVHALISQLIGRVFY